MKSVSIVINTYNRRKFLERTLNSLQYIRYPSFEVICVNGPSNDGTEEVLGRWEGKIKAISCPEANLSLSRNIGIKHASGEIVCFIDDDAVPEPGWLNAIVGAYNDPSVGAVGGYIRDHTGISYQAKLQVCDRFADCFSFNSLEDAIIDGKNYYNWNSDYYIALTGTNSSFRRDILEQMGGFDETFCYFLDETDVLLRICELGYTIKCIEGAEVYHKYAPSELRTAEKIAKTLYYPFRSKVYFAFRHALPRKGLKNTIERLEAYEKVVSSSQNFLWKTGKINTKHYDSLLNDIERAKKDGLALAFNASAPFHRDPAYFADPPSFHSFPVLKSATNRLKICFITQDYSPVPNGGIGVWVSILAAEMGALGHEVTVITRTQTEKSSIDFENGVWVHRIIQHHMPERPYSAPASLPQIVYDWSASAYVEAMKISLTRGLDCISAPIWDVEGIVAHQSGNIPVLLSLHTSYGLALSSKPLWQESQYLEAHVKPVIIAERLLLEQSPFIIANSRAIIKDINQCYKMNLPSERIVLIPHGIPDVNSYVPNAPTNNTCEILFVGRFEERKGIDILLKAIPEIVTKYPNVTFHLAGNNDVTDYWNKFKSKYHKMDWFSRVVSYGFVSPEKRDTLYKKCDIFIAPSRYESFGLIYIEAMRYGKPCIGTDIGGIPEVISNGLNGILVPPADAKTLIKAINELIYNKSMRQRMGKESRKLYLQNYTSKIMALSMEKAIRSFLEKLCSIR